MNAPVLDNEQARAEALQRYAVLDTSQEPAFERLTRLASGLLDMPIAALSLVDSDRQWFKSIVGLDVQQTERDLSFCAHAILETDRLLKVPDATQDARFADNPLVTGDPKIRFYAGAPIVTPDGFGLGALCVIDHKTREFSAAQEKILRDLADMAQDALELRLVNRQRAMQAAAMDALASGVVMTDPNLEDNPMVFCNPGFVAMTGYSADEILGRNCRFLQGPETSRAEVDRLRQAIADRRTYRGEILNYRKDGTPFWVELTVSPVFDDDGRLMNFVGLQVDITERRQMLEQLRANSARLRELDELRNALG